MARQARKIDWDILMASLKEAESDGAFPNFSKLFSAVAERYNAKTPNEKPITPAIVLGRLGEQGQLQDDRTILINGYKTLTAKGKRGRQPGSSGGRKGKEVDKNLLISLLKSLEEEQEFPNRSKLYAAVADAYNEQVEGGGLNQMTVYNRVKMWSEGDDETIIVEGYTIKTVKGRRGRRSGDSSSQTRRAAPSGPVQAQAAPRPDQEGSEPEPAPVVLRRSREEEDEDREGRPKKFTRFHRKFFELQAISLGKEPEAHLQEKAQTHGVTL